MIDNKLLQRQIYALLNSLVNFGEFGDAIHNKDKIRIIRKNRNYPPQSMKRDSSQSLINGVS